MVYIYIYGLGVLNLTKCVACVQERQLEGCRRQLEAAQKDFDYVQDQVTTMEVSLARVYNYDVAKRKEEKGAAS